MWATGVSQGCPGCHAHAWGQPCPSSGGPGPQTTLRVTSSSSTSWPGCLPDSAKSPLDGTTSPSPSLSNQRRARAPVGCTGHSRPPRLEAATPRCVPHWVTMASLGMALPRCDLARPSQASDPMGSPGWGLTRSRWLNSAGLSPLPPQEPGGSGTSVSEDEQLAPRAHRMPTSGPEGHTSPA